VTAAFAIFLLLSLIFSGAIAFASDRMRPRLKWLLIVSLLFTWAALGLAVEQIVSRTATTLVTPGGARQPRLADPVAREGLLLLAALGGPAAVASALGWLSLRATRPGRRRTPPASS
jgi:hypothetical protein